MDKKQRVVKSSCVLTMSPLITLGKAPLELYAHFVCLMVQTWCTAGKACSHAAAEAVSQRHPQRSQSPPAMLQVHNPHFTIPLSPRTAYQALLQWLENCMMEMCVHQAAREKCAHACLSMSSRGKVVHIFLHRCCSSSSSSSSYLALLCTCLVICMCVVMLQGPVRWRAQRLELRRQLEPTADPARADIHCCLCRFLVKNNFLQDVGTTPLVYPDPPPTLREVLPPIQGIACAVVIVCSAYCSIDCAVATCQNSTTASPCASVTMTILVMWLTVCPLFGCLH